MVLNDHDIEQLALNSKLIHPFHRGNLCNCRYNLRAGYALSSNDGLEIKLGNLGNGMQRLIWTIKPSETLMVMTTEKVKIPSNLMASYSQLNRWAEQGLMLVNTSVVEPGYEGYLSCFFVNFSKNTIDISKNADIAKICFYQLTNVPDQLIAYPPKSADAYRAGLSTAAMRYPKSFLNIGEYEQQSTEIEKRLKEKVNDVDKSISEINTKVAEIEPRITKNVTMSVRGSLLAGGIGLAVLIAFATFEPFFHHWIDDKTGIATETANLQKFQLDVSTAKSDLLKAQNDLILKEGELRDRIKKEEFKALTDRIDKLEKTKSLPGSSRKK